MMYYVFVHQPFATMACRGLLPAIFTDLQVESYPFKAYICALDFYKRAADYPYEWHQEYLNQYIFGNMPKVEDLPANALIGSVTVIGPTDIPGLFSVVNARQFVAPLQLPFHEFSQYEDIIERMNTTMFIPRVPHLIDHGQNLIVPLNVFSYDVASCGGNFSIELVGSFAKLVLDENGMLKPFTKFTIWYDDQGKSFLVDADTEIIHELTPDGSDLMRYPSQLSPDGTTLHAKLRFTCSSPLND